MNDRTTSLSRMEYPIPVGILFVELKMEEEKYKVGLDKRGFLSQKHSDRKRIWRLKSLCGTTDLQRYNVDFHLSWKKNKIKALLLGFSDFKIENGPVAVMRGSGGIGGILCPRYFTNWAKFFYKLGQELANKFCCVQKLKFSLHI